MPLFIISIVFQVLLVVHIVKTGRNTTWIWIVVMLPFAGSIAYAIVELLPGILSSKTGRKASRSLVRAVNPNRDLKQAVNHYSVTDTVENSMRLAAELLEKKQFAEAKQLYEKCLKGVHEYDPFVMFGLAKAEFALQNYSATRDVLDRLIEHNPQFKNPDAHLLYARAQEALGETEKALHEYQALHQYFPGPEPTYHYAMLSKQQGDSALAKELLEDIVRKEKISGSHYKSLHREWLKKTKMELMNL